MQTTNEKDSRYSNEYIHRALADWRAKHGKEWPYQGNTESQAHYRQLLIDYKRQGAT